ncbi:hypothetical protein HPB48_025574 [Haemaphysalis longicornis]|uniref:High-affinity choline transporter 1 n=1 Tax=Haemaphysalis longicornis TaxID=44386 RepID=A0A9J6H955_HAELO|nr:hypothetical protein HPB48_025574 [Haemaphysalis longicornis]
MAVNVTALIMLVCYYWAVVFLGVWAGRKAHSRRGSAQQSRASAESMSRKEDERFLMRLIVANRHMPLILGIGSMTATWVGGGYLNGTAEAVYTRGILYSHAPVGYAISLILGLTETRTRIAGFKVQSADHYTMRPHADAQESNPGLPSESRVLWPLDHSGDAAGITKRLFFPWRKEGLSSCFLKTVASSGGAFFADKMRVSKSVTMLDPLQTAYGRLMGVLLCVPAVCGEVFWTAAVMAALGDTANAIVEVDSRFFIVASAMVIFFYTSLGGLYSVTPSNLKVLPLYTVLRYACNAIAQWICVPFCLTHPVVGTIGAPERNWVGSIPASDYGQFLDLLLMTSLGGIPWQVYFQRVLGCDSDFTARMLSYISAIGCVFLAIPPIIIGAAAKSANFTAAGYLGPYRLRDKDRGSVLPLSIRYLTSGVVSMVGLIGITAAVMSSADSSMLSASSLVTRNIYQVVFRTTVYVHCTTLRLLAFFFSLSAYHPFVTRITSRVVPLAQASDNEVAVMLRVLVCVIGSWATYIALQVESVLELWSLCSDVVYVLLFPQLLCALYFKSTNTYGSLMAFLLGALFRVLCGEPRVNLKAVIRLPMYDDKLGQRFPFRLTCMILSLITLLVGSYVAAKLFEKRWLKPRYDIFDCFRPERAAETKRDKIKPATLPQARRNLDSGKVKDEVSGSTTRDTGRSAKSASQDSGKVRDEVSGSVTRGAARSAKAASQDSGKVKDEVSGSVTRATARSAKAATQDSGKVKDEVSGSVTRATARSAKAATQDSGKVKNEVPGSVTRGTVGLAKAASQDSVKVKDEVSGPATRDTAGSAKTASSADGGAESESRIDVKSQVEAIAAASVVPQDGETEPEQATPVEKPPRRPSRRRPSPSGFHR